MKSISVLVIVLIGLITPSRVQSEIRYGQVHKYYVGAVPYIADFTEHNGDYEKRPLHFGDFNGDDIVDIFIVNDKDTSKCTILHGAGDASFDDETLLRFNWRGVDYLVMDVNRDEFDDVVSTKPGLDNWAYARFVNSGSGEWSRVFDAAFVDGFGFVSLKLLYGVCDCNDDGYDDFIGQSEYDEIRRGNYFVIGINDTSEHWPVDTLFHDYGVGPMRFPVGDFNGDGWTDFIASDWWTPQLNFVYFGDGGCNFTLEQTLSNSYGVSSKLNVGNFNDDEYDDVVYSTGNEHNGIIIVFGGSEGFSFDNSVGYSWLTMYDGHWYANYIIVSDINGDGYDDVGVVERDFDEVNDLLPVYFHYSDGASFSSACDTLIVPSERYAHLWSADFNDDGADDLCYFSSIDTLAVYLSEAPTATLLRSFHARFEQSRGVVIDWEVAGTEDCERFVISRSVGDEPFSFIAEVPAVTGKLAYSYTDGQVRSAPGGKVGYRLDVYERDGSKRLLALEEVVIPEAVLRLYQNYPNPFNPGTKIVFDLPARMKVWLEIYDVAGRLVRRLVAERELGPGRSEEFWDGRNEQGLRVSSGVYHCTLRAGKETISRKLVILR